MKDSKGHEPSDYKTSVSNTLNGLEALKRIKSRYNDRVCIDILEDFDLVEKELKAFEIIKNKNISMECLKRAIKREGLEWYNSLCRFPIERLTQEEYDLLKEVLNK